MASDQLIMSFKALTAVCAKIVPDEFLSNSKWGTINFEASRPELQRTFDMLSELQNLPLAILPEQQLQSIYDSAHPFVEITQRIGSFSLDGEENPSAAKDRLVKELRDKADKFFMAAHGCIPYLAHKGGEVERKVAEVDHLIAETNKIVEKTKLNISDSKWEIERIIAAARDASGIAGVSHFAKDFGNEAEANQKQGKYWLIATAAFASATTVAAFVMMFFPLSNDATAAQIVRFFTSKAVLLAILFSATVWCGRLYKASKHLETLNKHRSNALKTFQAFVMATGDAPTRDAVLMETTRSIFMIAPSGYLDSADVSSDSGMKIVEVIKNISQVSK